MTKFSDLKLDPKVLTAISEAGYDSPTPIQAGAIPPALEGRDVLGIAQTGTGKTASFTLPMITLLGRGRARARMPRSLVLCPTRELAAQVAENFDIYAKHTRLTKALLIGGVSFGEQDKLIDRGVDVLIATPGRLLDHFERGKLLLTGVQIMVVDEADRMLDMGFIPDIERIFQLTPFTRQTLFFSATMAPEIERITDTFLHSPERIEVARQATTSETITQRLVEITPTRKDQTAKQKRELLRALIDAEGDRLTNAIIFCNRKTDVDIVAKSLKAHGYDAAPIHGDLDQSQRTRTLEDFREGRLRFLVASDVAARGLDIPAVSHVLNFDLPSHAEDYVHRIGRTGRAGRLGTAISIATPLDDKYLSGIEALVKQTLPRAAIPDGFTLSNASQNAPRTSGDGRSGDGRSRNGRSRDRRRPARESDRAEQGHGQEQAQSQAAGGPAPVRAPSESRASSRPETAAPAAPHPSSSHPPAQRRQDDQRDIRRDRSNDRRRSGDHNAVMGMGDHMPDFLTRSFRPELFAQAQPVQGEASEKAPAAQDQAAASAPAPQPAATTAELPQGSASQPEAPADDQAPTAAVSQPDTLNQTETPAEKPAEKPAPRRRSRAKAPAAAVDTVPIEVEPADTAQLAADTPAQHQSEPPSAPVETAETPATTSTDAPQQQSQDDTPKPAPRKRTTRSRKPAPKPDEAIPAADAAQPAAEPASSQPAATDEAPAKPVRRRTRKPAATAEQTATSDTDATPAPPTAQDATQATGQASDPAPATSPENGD